MMPTLLYTEENTNETLAKITFDNMHVNNGVNIV